MVDGAKARLGVIRGGFFLWANAPGGASTNSIRAVDMSADECPSIGVNNRDVTPPAGCAMIRVPRGLHLLAISENA